MRKDKKTLLKEKISEENEKEKVEEKIIYFSERKNNFSPYDLKNKDKLILNKHDSVLYNSIKSNTSIKNLDLFNNSKEKYIENQEKSPYEYFFNTKIYDKIKINNISNDINTNIIDSNNEIINFDYINTVFKKNREYGLKNYNDDEDKINNNYFSHNNELISNSFKKLDKFRLQLEKNNSLSNIIF
jgi:hypothetical protein